VRIFVLQSAVFAARVATALNSIWLNTAKLVGGGIRGHLVTD
jgi:hypothetical protein